MSVYDQWQLPGLLAMFDGENEYATNAHRQAWKRKVELLDQQRTRLEGLVTELVKCWDPAKSDAAELFIAKLKTMIVALDDAKTAVSSTTAMLDDVTGAMMETKSKLQSLLGGYTDSTAAAHEYNADELNLPGWLNPGRTMPGLDDIAMRLHQGKLDQQAREIMLASDVRVNDASGSMQPMPVMGYITPHEGVYDAKGDHSGGGSGPGGDSGNGSLYVPAPAFNPPPASVIVGGSAPQDFGDSPVLAGGPGPTPALGSPSPTLLTSPPALGDTPPTGWLPPVVRTGIIGEPPPPSRPATSRPGMPINGVLEGSPQRGGTPVLGGRGGPAPRGASGTTPARSMGTGVTRGQPASTTRAPSGGGWQDRSFAQYAERRAGGRKQCDPDDPWEVKEGVAPVLEAPEPPSGHNAGPGVIGLDR